MRRNGSAKRLSYVRDPTSESSVATFVDRLQLSLSANCEYLQQGLKSIPSKTGKMEVIRSLAHMLETKRDVAHDMLVRTERAIADLPSDVKLCPDGMDTAVWEKGIDDHLKGWQKHIRLSEKGEGGSASGGSNTRPPQHMNMSPASECPARATSRGLTQCNSSTKPQAMQLVVCWPHDKRPSGLTRTAPGSRRQRERQHAAAHSLQHSTDDASPATALTHSVDATPA